MRQILWAQGGLNKVVDPKDVRGFDPYMADCVISQKRLQCCLIWAKSEFYLNKA